MQTIVMSGGTSGFGAVTLKQLVQTKDVRVLLGARGTPPAGVETLALDLASLGSVRAFATAVIERLGGATIDALVLNAGISQRDDSRRTVDGFEVTFAVNHLAHYLLLTLLMPHLSPGAVVVLTTSGTHDPEVKTFLPMPPRHADARLLAHPDTDPEHDTDPRAAGARAYTASKLCNVLTVRALATQQTAQAGQWRAVAFDPGPTPGTGLLRDTPPAMRLAWRLLSGVTRVLARFNSREATGEALAGIALGRITPPDDRYYARVIRNRLAWVSPSQLARRDDVMRMLWRDSAELVGSG